MLPSTQDWKTLRLGSTTLSQRAHPYPAESLQLGMTIEKDAQSFLSSIIQFTQILRLHLLAFSFALPWLQSFQPRRHYSNQYPPAKTPHNSSCIRDQRGCIVFDDAGVDRRPLDGQGTRTDLHYSFRLWSCQCILG